MSMKKKNLIAKFFKLVGRGNQIKSSKSCLSQMYAERKKLRQRNSMSSQNSQFERMPTIFEEDEGYVSFEDTRI